MVAPSEMGLFMGDDAADLGLLQIRGQIDAGGEDAQDKGRSHGIAEPDILPKAHGGRHFPAQPDIACQGVEKQSRQPCRPQPGGQEHHDLHGIHACVRFRRQGSGNGRIHRIVQYPDAAVDFRFPGHHDFPGHGLLAWNQAQHAFYGKGADQPDAHQNPQGAAHCFWGFPQENPQKHYSQDDPACGDAHVQQL